MKSVIAFVAIICLQSIVNGQLGYTWVPFGSDFLEQLQPMISAYFSGREILGPGYPTRLLRSYYAVSFLSFLLIKKVN
jgi:hypothetical protein